MTPTYLHKNAKTPKRLDTSENPIITIIIPVCGKWDLTRRCLAALASTYAVTPYELIVVDDASPDDTAINLRDIEGVRVFSLSENVGFLRACNAAMSSSRGDWVVFLNNDTQVQQGWLDALYIAAIEEPAAGIVGARLISRKGVLQEAGGIIFRDGGGWNYGRGWGAEDPRVLHRREVDYVSGAAMLVRGSLLQELGGFDDRYIPAYYEDTDLAFSARELGFRVIYEPRSVVVHEEGGTHGRDVNIGVKAHQLTNQEIFFTKWRSALSAHFCRSADVVDLARVHGTPRRLLVVDHAVPTPDRDSGSRRMAELLSMLQTAGWSVTFVPYNGASLEPYASVLRSRGVEVIPGTTREVLQRLGSNIDVAVVSRFHVAERWIPLLRRRHPKATILFDTVDLHFLRAERAAISTGASGRAAAMVRRRELAAVKSADATLVVADYEREMLSRVAPGSSVAVVSNIEAEASVGPSFAERNGLLFVGSCLHPPNLDGIRWFVQSVLPRVAAQIPEVNVKLVGNDPYGAFDEFAGSHVEVVGWVADLEPVYASVRVSIAPLRYGAGVKGKVGDSLRHGVPVVGTSVAFEGMGLVHEFHVLCSDDADELASMVVKMYRDRELWEKMRDRGREHVLEQFSRKRALDSFNELVNVLRTRS